MCVCVCVCVWGGGGGEAPKGVRLEPYNLYRTLLLGPHTPIKPILREYPLGVMADRA